MSKLDISSRNKRMLSGLSLGLNKNQSASPGRILILGLPIPNICPTGIRG